MSVRHVTTLLGDQSLRWAQRRTRLQGWRGDDAVRADEAVLAQRLAAAVCAVGAFVGAALESPLILSLFAGTALVGAVAPNHPFEVLYNRWAAHRARPTLPPNRAAKRLGCAIGLALLGGAAVAFAVGATSVGTILALMLGITATFVAITGICLPSMLFTALWGADRASEQQLRPRSPRVGIDCG